MKFFIDVGTHYRECLSAFNKKLKNLSEVWAINCFEQNHETDSVFVVNELTKLCHLSFFIHKKAASLLNKTKDVEFLCSKRDTEELKDHYTFQWLECYDDEVSRNNIKLNGVSSHIISVKQDTCEEIQK